MDCVENFKHLLSSVDIKENETLINGFFNNEKCELTTFLDNLAKNGFSFSTRTSREYAKRTIYCSYETDNMNIDCGTLFSKDEQKFLSCAHGKKYYKLKEDKPVPDHPTNKKGRFHLQSTKKMECPASLKVLKITCYLDYKMQKNAHWYVKKKEIDRLKQNLLKEVPVRKEIRYYFSLSMASVHNHSTTTTFLNQHINKSVEEQIHSLVEKGISNMNYIKQHLKDYVRENYSNIDFTSAAFYPNEQIIYNYVLKYLNKKQKGLIDQEKVENIVNEWKKNVNDNIYYRPYSETNGEVKPLLFCYQNSWQKDLLQRYGEVCCLDGTYKTMKYALPLYFIVVKTNVNYIVVAVIIIQHEDAASIKEALGIIKAWNPTWAPKYWMTDFCQAEIKAIHSSFDCATFICSFHREQCWIRWLKNKDNVENQSDGNVILKFWRGMAHSQTEKDYNAHLDSMKKSPSWLNNSKVQHYFTETWLPVREKWCEAFFSDDYLLKIHTNNGIERQNGILKHQYLQKYSNKSMASVLEVIVTKFLCDAIKNYTTKNSKLDSNFKTYNKEIPSYLLDRPIFFIKHVYTRIATAKNIYSTESIRSLGENKFLVRSENSSTWYAVDFSKPMCTCDDFRRWRFPCKHLSAVFLYVPNHSFLDLPPTYLQSPFITIDQKYNIFTSNLDYENQNIIEPSGSRINEILETEDGITTSNAVESSMNPTQSSNKIKNEIQSLIKKLLNNSHLIPNDIESNDDLETCYNHLKLANNILDSKIIQKNNGVQLLPLPPPKKRKL